MSRMTCLSCTHYRKAGCEINCDKHPTAEFKWPMVGDKCASFNYEPGTSPAEWPTYEDYIKETLNAH